jgi:ETC complex I subunit conserved region
MPARIVQLQKNAMQSGKAKAGIWVLEFESARRKVPDPLTGWAGGAETNEQVRLTFPTLAAAQAYAAKNGLDAHVVPAPQPKLKLQAYADNFR